MGTRTKLNESVGQPRALPDFLRSLQAVKQTLDQIRADVADRKRAQDEVLSGVEDTLAHLPKLDEICDIYILQVLDLCEGNRIRAAQILGIGRTSLYRYLHSGNFQNQARSAFQTGTQSPHKPVLEKTHGSIAPR